MNAGQSIGERQRTASGKGHRWLPSALTILATVTTTQLQAAELVLQPGPEPGKDSYVSSKFPNDNYGASVNLRVGLAGVIGQPNTIELARAFLEFDLSSLPAGAEVVSADLEVYAAGVFGTAAPRIAARPIMQGWEETVVARLTQPGVSTSNVDTADFALGSEGWGHWNVTSLVEEWVTLQRPNFGVALVSTRELEEAASMVWFVSSDVGEAEEAKRPQLRIAYTGSLRLDVPRLSDQGIELRVRGTAGRSCAVEYSPDLVSWTELTMITLGDDGVRVLVDPHFPAVSTRFYRARQIPPGPRVVRPAPGDCVEPGGVLCFEWEADDILNPIWKFALNKATVHQFPLAVTPVHDGGNRWHACWTVPAGLTRACDYDLWVKDDSTGLDAHSGFLCIGCGITILRPTATDRGVPGQVLRIEWKATNIPNPIWKFALNKGTVHQFPLAVTPVPDGGNTWHADWTVPEDLVWDCDDDLWVKDDSTGVDDHSEFFCIGPAPVPKITILRPTATDRGLAGQVLRIEWQAEHIPSPVWKFALNKAPVHQAWRTRVQKHQCSREGDRDIERCARRQPALANEFAAECAWRVTSRLVTASGLALANRFPVAVCQFHDVPEALAVARLADSEDVHQTVVIARMRLEAADPFDLLHVSGALAERWTSDDLHGAQGPKGLLPCQPHFAGAAAPDPTEQSVARDGARRLLGRRGG